MARVKRGDTITEKQAAFARAFFETANAAEAYRRAYDVAPDARDGWIYVEACQLLDNPKVARRLEELRDEAQKLSLYTVSVAFDEYEAARKMAHDDRNPSAAIAAVTGKVKLFGLDKPTRVDHSSNDGSMSPAPMVSALDRIKERLDAIAERSGKAGDTDAK